MKRNILIIGLTFLIKLSIIGQNFISADKQWNVILNGGYGLTTEIFQIEGDSIVDSISYSKIWVSYDSLATRTFQGLLREESNIVYFIPPDMNEGILYDFNLEIGDTTSVKNIFCGNQLIPITIINIDTVEYFGISHKRWFIGEEGNVEEIWIEGIGSLNGPLYTKYWYCIVCPVWELLCYHNNNTLEYIMTGETECFQNTVGIDDNLENDKIDFLIKPNPANKGTDIYLETNSEPTRLSIFSSTGNLVKTINPESSKNIKIETNNFESGLYFITIMTKDNRMKTKKILIK